MYDSEDIEALKSHTPEYNQIEKQSKKDGTWFKMEDGSKWEGDPRSWVQLMSNAAVKLRGNKFPSKSQILYSGVRFADPNPQYNGIQWASNSKNIGLSYNGNHPDLLQQLVIPKNLNTKYINAQGKHWGDLKETGYRDTNEFIEDSFDSGYSVGIIDNVIDPGAAMRRMKPEIMWDLLNTPYRDTVLKQGTLRKSIIGNNGNFDLTNPNIYKGLIPIGILSGFLSKK